MARCTLLGGDWGALLRTHGSEGSQLREALGHGSPPLFYQDANGCRELGTLRRWCGATFKNIEHRMIRLFAECENQSLAQLLLGLV